MPIVSEEYKQTKKEEILRAAHRCFHKKGYSNTTMRDILKEANISAGGLYNYFSGKEEMLQELVKEGRDSSKKIFDEVLEDWQSDNPLTLILRCYFDNTGKKSPKIKGVRTDFTIWAASLSDKRVMAMTRESYQESTFRIADFIEAIRKQGNIREDVDSKSLALIVISIIEGLSVQRKLNPEFDMEAYETAFIQLMESIGA